MNVIIFLLNAKAFNIGLLITFYYYYFSFDFNLIHLSTKTFIHISVQCSMCIKNCNKIMLTVLLFTNHNNHMVKVKADCNKNSL